MKTLPILIVATMALAAPAESFAANARTRHGAAYHTTRQQDRANFDHSGTRGRMGLGANPNRPEGPGRVQTR